MSQRIYQPWLRPDTDDKREENVRWLQNLGDLGGGVHRPTTLVIAAVDSDQAGKDAADFVCSGANDHTIIQAAISDLMATGGTGGRIIFLEGHYAIGATINVSGAQHPITLEGQDRNNTVLTSTSGTRAFLCTGANNVITFRNLFISCTGGACIESTTGLCEVDGCGLVGFRGFYGNYASSGQGARIYNNEISVTGTGCRGIQMLGGAGEYIVNNRVTVSGVNSRGISNSPNGTGFSGIAYIANNVVGQVVKDATAAGIYIGWWFFDETTNVTVANNKVTNFGIGIQLDGGDFMLVQANHIADCSMGIDTDLGNTALTRTLIMGNLFSNTNGAVAHIRFKRNSNTFDDVAVLYNKFIGTTPAYCLDIAAGCTDCAWFGNDTYLGFGTAAYRDLGTNTRFDSSFISTGLAPTGGTTNQVLKKNTNTNYDYSWALDPAIDVIGAKGDLLVGTAADAIDRLAIGATYQILEPDSAVSLGVKWGRKITSSKTGSPPVAPASGDIWLDLGP